MKLLLVLLLAPIMFADETGNISVHVPEIQDFASQAALKKAGIAKLKPAQLDALNDIIDQIALQVAQDTADQIVDQLEQMGNSDDRLVKSIPLAYEDIACDSTDGCLTTHR